MESTIMLLRLRAWPTVYVLLWFAQEWNNINRFTPWLLATNILPKMRLKYPKIGGRYIESAEHTHTFIWGVKPVHFP
jgi:hypothetical protein